jgi:hypothetical protein
VLYTTWAYSLNVWYAAFEILWPIIVEYNPQNTAVYDTRFNQNPLIFSGQRTRTYITVHYASIFWTKYKRHSTQNLHGFPFIWFPVVYLFTKLWIVLYIQIYPCKTRILQSIYSWNILFKSFYFYFLILLFETITLLLILQHSLSSSFP